jgi:hypothetical protein
MEIVRKVILDMLIILDGFFEGPNGCPINNIKQMTPLTSKVQIPLAPYQLVTLFELFQLLTPITATNREDCNAGGNRVK